MWKQLRPDACGPEGGHWWEACSPGPPEKSSPEEPDGSQSPARLPHTGSFLIVYVCLMFLVGVPLLLLEMAAGQRMRQGSIGVWKIVSPWLGGVGYTSFLNPSRPLGVLHRGLVLQRAHDVEPLLLDSVPPVPAALGAVPPPGELQSVWNAEEVRNLVVAGVLPPEASFPESLYQDISATYSAWVSSLPEDIRNVLLPYLTNCSLNEELKEVMEGPGVALVAFTDIVSMFKRPAFWAIIIFVFLVTLGLSTLMGIVQGIITPLQDSFSSLRKHTKLLTVSICAFMFLSSLVFVGPSGSYYMNLLDDYWASVPLFCVLIMENIAIVWIYGARSPTR